MNGRLLIVDDEDPLRKALQLLFTEQHPDWEIEASGSVQEALEVIRQKPAFDVVIADMRMPEGEEDLAPYGEEGLRVAEAVQEKDPVTETLVFTAYPNPENMLRAAQLGGLLYLDKKMPNSTAVLSQVVDTCMARVQRLRQALEEARWREQVLSDAAAVEREIARREAAVDRDIAQRAAAEALRPMVNRVMQAASRLEQVRSDAEVLAADLREEGGSKLAARAEAVGRALLDVVIYLMPASKERPGTNGAPAKSHRDEIVRRGEEIYEREIRAQVEPDNRGKFLVVDVETGDYEMDQNRLAAVNRLRERRPEATLYTLRVGYPAAYRMGGRYPQAQP